MANEEAVLKTRIVQKHDTEANWIKAGKAAFTPLKGELIIYDADSTNAKQRIKIGDGRTNINQLKFFGNEWDYILDNSYSKINWEDVDGYQFVTLDGNTFFNGLSGKVYVDINANVYDAYSNLDSSVFKVPSTITHLHLEHFFNHYDGTPWEGLQFVGNGSQISGNHSCSVRVENFSGVQGLRGRFINCSHLSDCIGVPEHNIYNEWVGPFQNCTYVHNCSASAITSHISISTFSGCTFLDNIVVNGSGSLVDGCIFSDCHYLNNIRISKDIIVDEDRAGFYSENCTHIDAFTCDRYIEQVGKDKLLITGDADNITFMDKSTKVSEFTNDAGYVTETELNAKGYATETYTNNTFSNALKETASGNSVRINDVFSVTHELTVKVRGKNLIPYPYAETTITKNGITFTDNGDGSITVNGTATKSTPFYLTSTKAIKLSAGTYTISGGKSGVIVLARKNNTSWISSGNGNTQTGTFNSNDVFDYFGLYVATGTTVDNVTIYPMFELGSTATAYAPYVPDLTNVKVRKCGKNLLPYPYAETTKTLNEITITDNGDGSIDLNGTSIGQVNFYFSQNLRLKKGITYTLSASGNYSFSGSVSFYIYNSTYGALAYINLSVDNSYTFTPTKDINGINCYIVIPSDRTVSGTFKPQIELDSTATKYEQYITPTEYTPNADGSVGGVTSIYPCTTLTSDTNGVIIDCEYNRELNKAFAELLQAIISLGGNI